MDIPAAPAGLSLARLEAALADPAIAALETAGAPVFIACGEPARVVWANSAVQALFRAASLDELSRRVASIQRFGEIGRTLRPGAPARLERLRIAAGRNIELVTFVCRRIADAPPLLVAAATEQRSLPRNARRYATLSRFAEAAEPEPSAVAGEIAAASPGVIVAPPSIADLAAEMLAASPVAAPAAEAELPSEPEQRPSSAEIAADFSARFNDAPVVRFLWRTDRRRRLTEITGELCAVIGCDEGQLIGADFVEIAEAFGAEPHERLLSALARRDTWSGVEMLWPIGNAEAAVPITLGALPCNDAAQGFDGFRGFGVVHIQRVEPFLAPMKHDASDEREAPEARLSGQAIAGAPAGDEESPTQAEPPFAPQSETAPVEPPVSTDEAAGAGEKNPQAPESVDETMQTLPVAAEISPAPAVAETRGDETESTHSEAPDVAANPEVALDEEADALDRDIHPPQPEGGAQPNANVVTLRPAYRVAPPAHPPAAANDSADQPKQRPGENATPKPPPKRPPEPAIVELTPQERNAFREIARALGAKAEAEADIPRSSARESARSPASDTRGLRIRDLIDIASEAPPPAAAAASVSNADALARNAATLFERLPVGVLISRLEMPIHLNAALLDMLGFESAEAFHAAGGLDRMFRGREPRALAEAAGGGAIPIVTRTGDVLSVIARIQSIEWDGAPASMTTFRETREADLAPRLRSLEAELRHRDSELRESHAVLDTATDGVIMLDAEGRILALNKSAEALFGYDQNEVAGEKFTTLLAKESHAAADDYIEGLKTNGVASLLNDGREVTGRARQGGGIPVFMTLGRISTAGAQKFCAVLRDMTAWKKAERELSDAKRDAERASALKSEFLAKVSHEIRTPLNAIIGFAEVIMGERFGPVGNDRYKDYLKDIHASGAHVMSLVNDLLDLSKIEAGKLELDFGAVDANKVIAECVSLMQPQATRERVVIRQSLAPRLPNIVADERSLRQIVLNLLSNAVKFNDAGGQVIVSTALTDAGHAVIRIKDTGVGMSEADVQTALEPFRQLHTARNRGGTGLGLPLTKSLVEANRASFTIKSRKKEGTLVEVAFPPTRVLAE